METTVIYSIYTFHMFRQDLSLNKIYFNKHKLTKHEQRKFMMPDGAKKSATLYPYHLRA